MLKIFKYLKPKEWLMTAISVIFIVLQVWLDLKLPDFMFDLTTIVKTPGSELSEVWKTGGLMLLVSLGSLAVSLLIGFLSARISANFSAKLREELFARVESFSSAEINDFSTASLITRTTNDISQVQRLVTMGLQVLIKAPIMAVLAIIKIIGKGYVWSIATAITLVLILIVFAVVLIIVVPKFKVMQKLTDDLNQVTRETLKGQRVVRAYNAEEYEQEKFETANNNLTATNLYTSQTMAFMMPTISFLMNGLTLSIYIIGAYLINNQIGLVGKTELYANMIVFSSYAMQVIMAFMMSVMIFMILPRASVSAKRILEVLERRPTITDGLALEGVEGQTGDIEFKNVSFKYPDAVEYVLKDINLVINHGETVAFIGSTGSGKSTLINLVPRFFDATEGEIIIDGLNIKDYKLESLYNKIGYVSQKAVLFKGTVGENVSYGSSDRVDNTYDTIDHALRVAQARDFVASLEEGQAANIAQSGLNLSGGQKQRISIARAVHKNPEIYIFDDSFSALDYKTDFNLRSTLKREMTSATTLIVAQRIGTIREADKIVVLDSGKIVGVGKHEELLESCPIYKEIALSQLSEEEIR